MKSIMAKPESNSKEMPNLFSDLPDDLSKEVIQILAEGKNIRIERIVSHAQSSPDGFWYEQDQSEWVVVLNGAAKLKVEGNQELVHLSVGDHVLIPAHQRHRVEWTSHNEPTIWLAVFFEQ
jgi:cupin 2 domain-containing protein